MAEAEYTPTLAEVLTAATYRIAGTLGEPEWSQARAAVDRALAAHDAQVKAEAWDAALAWLASRLMRGTNPVGLISAGFNANPYRAAETEAWR